MSGLYLIIFLTVLSNQFSEFMSQGTILLLINLGCIGAATEWRDILYR